MAELKHYGILGMKWGVRRFQNEDGSLTGEGRRRYGVSGTRASSDELFDKQGNARGLTKDITIKRGTELNKVMVQHKTGSAQHRSGQSYGDREYFSLTSEDNNTWTSYMRRTFGPAKLKQVATTTTKDVKIASATKIGEEYAKAVLATKKSGKWDLDSSDVEDMANMMSNDAKTAKMVRANVRTADISVSKNKKDRSTVNAYKGSFAISKGPEAAVTRAMIDSLKKQGYGGAFDYLGTNVASTPIILFDSPSQTGARYTTNAGETAAAGRQRTDAVVGTIARGATLTVPLLALGLGVL